MAAVVRKARPGDATEVARLFHETVHQVNAADYTPAQCQAWSPKIKPDTYWKRRFRKHQAFVAVDGDSVVGFAELDAEGYIDAFFVHRSMQRKGVGRQLMLALFQASRAKGLTRLSADVSITAEPFFRAMGFQLIRRTKRFYRNQIFRQYRMVRILRR